MTLKISSADIAQLKTLGIDGNNLQWQLQCFESGSPSLNISRPATVGDGIIRLNKIEEQTYVRVAEAHRQSAAKFVPASGLATRMFKELFEFVTAYENCQNLKVFEQPLDKFFMLFDKLPFSRQVKDKMGNIDIESSQGRYRILKVILETNQLNYGLMPKALLPFHSYPHGSVTALQEQIISGVDYIGRKGRANYHFTILERHQEQFENYWQQLHSIVEREIGMQCEVDFSFQNSETDTISIDAKTRQPLLDSNSLIYLRPAGHGTLLSNLFSVDADIIFINNIDNIAHRSRQAIQIYYKKVLAGLLLDIRARIFDYMEQLDHLPLADIPFSEITDFIVTKLYRPLPKAFSSWESSKQLTYIKSQLDCPLRICGMVPHQGDIGGGPYWVIEHHNAARLQILERHQLSEQMVDMTEIIAATTYFNPVEMVCSLHNYKKKLYLYEDYIDEKQYFIAEKSYKDKPIKVLERPGLWNGSMAKWNSIFVEIPIDTFAPVKTIGDLLNPIHQEV